MCRRPHPFSFMFTRSQEEIETGKVITLQWSFLAYISFIFSILIFFFLSNLISTFLCTLLKISSSKLRRTKKVIKKRGRIKKKQWDRKIIMRGMKIWNWKFFKTVKFWLNDSTWFLGDSLNVYFSLLFKQKRKGKNWKIWKDTI